MKSLMKSRPEKKNEKGKLERQGYPGTAYSYIFMPINICPPPEEVTVKKFILWNASGNQSLYDLAWLNPHKYRRE